MRKQSSGFLRHISNLNRWNPDHFRPFYIADQRVGYLKHNICQALTRWPGYFSISDKQVILSAGAQTGAQRSEVLDEVVQRLAEQGVIEHYLGELYPVTGTGREQQLAKLDRGAAAYFGIRTYGQHLNGFVSTAHGLLMWVARRAPERIHFPNMLDNLVAGGLPENLSLESNLLKECREEANIPEHLVKTARAVGAVSYCRETEAGLKPDTLYCYDLSVPESFVPENTDGEVAEFRLLPIDQVIELVRDSDEFKPNCNLVNIDFFIRHGLLTADEPDYRHLVSGLDGLNQSSA